MKPNRTTDDDGNVIGIDNAKKLLEMIPSKITDTMGIIADVNLLYKDGLEYLEIVVDKYPSLISFLGKYYYRSGIIKEQNNEEYANLFCGKENYDRLLLLFIKYLFKHFEEQRDISFWSVKNEW